jgi:3-oxoacyl-[acyl-carrier protein] reductase
MSSKPLAIVSGGGRSVGRTITEALIEMGMQVAICGRSREELDRARRELSGVDTRQLDVRHHDRVASWVDDLAARHGRIDVLVNNAAILTPIGPVVETALHEWLDTITVNLMGAVAFIKAVLPHMIRRRYGRIINLGGGGSAYPRPNYSAYACSKAALVRLTDTVAEEVRDYNITVNVLSPGRQRSRMREQERAAGVPFPDQWDDPASVKALTRFLVEAPVTGKFLHVRDDYRNLTDRLIRSDLYTLRRVGG